MKKFGVIFLLAFAGYVRAQPVTTTTYVGTVRDLTGAIVTSGRITWQSNAPAGMAIPGTGSFVSTTVSCQINATGNPVASSDGTSPCLITNNTALTPSGTSYTMCTQPYNVSPGSCIVTYATGGTIDISTIVPTPTTGPFNFSGTPGPPNSLAIGTVTKIPAGGSPTADITGIVPAQTLNLGLVTGDTGAQGSTGSTGPTGPIGPLGPTGPPGGSLSYPGCTSDGSNGFKCTGAVTAPTKISATSPMADVRAYGAVIDATNTPIDNALLSAINSCNTLNAYSNSCQVLLPCAGINTSSGCTITNGSLLPANTSGKTIELNFQGTLTLKSTLVIPNYYTILAKGGSSGGQFQSVGANARILGPPMKGGIGTSVPGAQVGSITAGTGSLTLNSVTNHTVGETIQATSAGFGAVDYRGTVTAINGNVLTVSPNSALNLAGALWTVVSKFTPTYGTGSTPDNFHVNSAIGVGGYQTCTAVTATRDGTIAANAPNTTFIAGSQISQISITSNVLTVWTPNSPFTVGQTVGLVGFKQASLLFLNGQLVTIATADATKFTAAFTHADMALSSDSGAAPSATTCVSSSGIPESIRIPVAQTVTVTGCADSSFNVNQANVNGQDWPANSIQIYQGGAVGVTGISIANNVLTVTANNNFTAGQQVTFFNLRDHTFLNGLTITIATASPTQFTIALPPALARVNEALSGDLGEAVVSLATSSTTGCTVTGIDDYNYEVVRIEGIDTVPITQIGITSNVLTVTANNTFSVGELVNFSQLKTNTYLNGQTVTILTASGTGFTAAFNHTPNVTLAADTGAVGRMNALASGAVLSATFAHTHDPADLWGMVAVSTSDQQSSPKSHFDMQSVLISNAYGPQLWLDNTATINLTGVSLLPVQYPTSAALDCSGCWWGQMNSIQALGNPVTIHCITNCGTPAYSYSLRFTQDSTRRNFIGGADMIVRDLTVVGGIKIDGNGMDLTAGAGPQLLLSNPIVERQAYGGIVVDNSRGIINTQVAIDMMLLSDNYSQVLGQYLAATDCCYSQGFANIGQLSPFAQSYTLTNPYWTNGVQAGGLGTYVVNPSATFPHTSTGFLNDGSTLNANVRGSGANLSPALIPAATLAVLSPSCGTCIPVTGPDGVANSALEVQTSAGPTNAVLMVASLSTFVTYPGDMMAYGAWVAPGALNVGKTPGSSFGANAYFQLLTSGADLFQGGIGALYSPSTPNTYVFGGGLLSMVSDSWQPGMQIVTFTKGDTTAHNIKMSVYSGSTANGVGSGNRFWDWWWMYIPGPNNPAYTGVTRQEVMRWMQDMLHSYIPPNVPAGGGILATCPGCRYSNLAVAAARRGTFTCTAGGTITVANANAISTSDITFSLNTAGGTPAAPAMKTPGNGTNFQVLCGAADTSTYNYAIWN